jgi:hypothetical protein
LRRAGHPHFRQIGQRRRADWPRQDGRCRAENNFYRENVNSSRNRENHYGRRHNFPAKITA